MARRRFVFGLAPLLFFVIGPAVSARAEPPAAEPGEPAPWRQADGPWAWQFPRDHGLHPDFRSEWWYFTGNLRDAAGRPFGYQLTFFRQGLRRVPAQPESRWSARDLWFGHFTISDIRTGRFHVAERVTRAALGEAHAAADRMEVALGPWAIAPGDGPDRYRVTAQEPDLAIDLDLAAVKPLVLEGVDGLSRKADEPGAASYYYSYPRLATTGKLRVGAAEYAVAGTSWFDHEFSTSLLGKNQVGWDWFCVQLDDHEELMLYAMRTAAGGIDPVSEGTWVPASGPSQRLPPGSFRIEKLGEWRSPATGAVYPAGWRLTIPGHAAELTVEPALADQELRLDKMGPLDYWEGACTVRGRVAGRDVRGVGYTELTGYAGRLRTTATP